MAAKMYCNDSPTAIAQIAAPISQGAREDKSSNTMVDLRVQGPCACYSRPVNCSIFPGNRFYYSKRLNAASSPAASGGGEEGIRPVARRHRAPTPRRSDGLGTAPPGGLSAAAGSSSG